MNAQQATREHDKNEQDLSNKVVETVAEAEGVEPTELDTPYTVRPQKPTDESFRGNTLT